MLDWDAAPGIDPERVAEVLVTPAGRVDQRRHALAGERWLDALEPLGRLDPGALAAIDRELHAGRR